MSKSPEAKKAARGACAALVAELGDGEFQSRVASHLPKSSADAFASAGKDEEKKSAKKVSAMGERAKVGLEGESRVRGRERQRQGQRQRKRLARGRGRF